MSSTQGGAIALMSRCLLAPSMPLFGAFFPAWLYCMVGGFLAAVVVRAALVRLKRERLLGPPVAANTLLFVLFSFVIWLLVF